MGRPVGITMLSVLAILSGVLGGLVVVMPFASQANLSELTQHVGMPSWLLLGSLVFTALMSFLSGVGMWGGKLWGWWLAAFGFVYAMLKDANAIWMIPKLIERYGTPDRGAGYYYLKYGFRYQLGALISGKTRLEAVRMDLRELVVVRNEQGFVNLDALRAVQVSRAHNKANSARPLRPASPPLIREFPVNLHERFGGVTSPHALAALVISRALAKTAVPDLAKLDLKPLQAQIALAVEHSLGKVVDGMNQHQLAAARTKRLFGF